MSEQCKIRSCDDKQLWFVEIELARYGNATDYSDTLQGEWRDAQMGKGGSAVSTRTRKSIHPNAWLSRDYQVGVRWVRWVITGRWSITWNDEPMPNLPPNSVATTYPRKIKASKAVESF